MAESAGSPLTPEQRLTEANLEVMLETLRHPPTEQEPLRIMLYADRIELLIRDLRASRLECERARALLSDLVKTWDAAKIPSWREFIEAVEAARVFLEETQPK